MNQATAKSACPHCEVPIEFPVEMAGSMINCPACQQPTDLPPADVLEAEGQRFGIAAPELLALFGGPVPRTKPSFFYQLGLLVVTGAMLLLPVLYLGLIGIAAWGVYEWATRGILIFSGVGGARLMILKVIIYVAPLFAGTILVFFMVKPVLARRPKSAQPLALNPGAEPLLFAFIAKICETVGAPFPKRIDLDCRLNASASYRRGALSLLGQDLVLTIGLPLVAGLNVTQFAGVLAHEFGHFTQGFGMRMTYVIRSVNSWFARVVYERDTWDERLEEWAAGAEDGRFAFIIGCARFAVWCSRLVLKALMYIGHGIGCFMLRQMEFDADRYQMKVAGSPAFEDTMRCIHVLGHVSELTYKNMRTGWNQSRELPENFPDYLMSVDRTLRDARRMQLEDRLGLGASGVFDTHPSHGDRIRAARRAGEPGVFGCELPATALFNNFEVPAKQVTLFHYADDLGIPPGLATMVKPRIAPSPQAVDPDPEASSAPMPGRLRLKIR